MYIIFDIGGTNMRIASSQDGLSFGQPIIVDTPPRFEDAKQVFADAVNKLTNGKIILGVAGGIAGCLNDEKSTLLSSPHLPGWVGKPIHQTFFEITKAQVFLENDTVLVALGEAHDGAGQDDAIMVYFTVSTGVGGARIVNGKVDAKGIGFEPGHQILDIETLSTLEDLISGSAFRKRYGKAPREVTDPAIWKEAARILAIGIHNSILHWSPDSVVIGGPMVLGNPAIPFDEVVVELKKIMKVVQKIPQLKRAKLGNTGGLSGALAYLRERLEIV